MFLHDQQTCNNDALNSNTYVNNDVLNSNSNANNGALSAESTSQTMMLGAFTVLFPLGSLLCY